jgi:hypothetical protein
LRSIFLPNGCVTKSKLIDGRAGIDRLDKKSHSELAADENPENKALPPLEANGSIASTRPSIIFPKALRSALIPSMIALIKSSIIAAISLHPDPVFFYETILVSIKRPFLKLIHCYL